MNLAFDAKRLFQAGGALAFIVLSALSAAQARTDALAEAYVLGLICVSTIGLAVGAAALARGPQSDQSVDRAAAKKRLDFEQSVDATLTHVLKLIQDHFAEGAKFQEFWLAPIGNFHEAIRMTRSTRSCSR